MTYKEFKSMLETIESERSSLRKLFVISAKAEKAGICRRIDGLEFKRQMDELDSLERQVRKLYNHEDNTEKFIPKKKWVEVMPQCADAPTWHACTAKEARAYQKGPLAQDINSRDYMRAVVSPVGDGKRRKWEVLK